MPNTLDNTGLTVKLLPEIISDLTAGFQSIYGTDIVLTSNSKDGQVINLIAQAIVDYLELLVNVYNSFDPAQAIGTQLDSRCVINNINRMGATYSQQNIQITVNQSLTLQGLDANANSPTGTGYTVADNLNNQWILLDTQYPNAPGTYTYVFRAQNLGPISTVPNTITNPVTVILGVTGINNSTGILELGQDGETDAQLELRRSRSVANASTGYLNGLQGQILDVVGVTDGQIFENVTDTTDSNNVPPHSIWTIIEGGADSDIANVIYKCKSYGCNMKGSTVVNIITPAGQILPIKFDRPISQNLYIRFNIQPTITGQIFDSVGIANYIVTNLAYSVNQIAETSSIIDVAKAAINITSGGGVPLSLQISNNNSTWVQYLSTTTPQYKWSVTANNINITIL